MVFTTRPRALATTRSPSHHSARRYACNDVLKQYKVFIIPGHGISKALFPKSQRNLLIEKVPCDGVRIGFYPGAWLLSSNREMASNGKARVSHGTIFNSVVNECFSAITRMNYAVCGLFSRGYFVELERLFRQL